MPESQSTWTDVKAKLASVDRTGLLALVRDLYASHEDNRTFLHARFGSGEDVLEVYKQAIDRWIWPDVLRNQDASVAKAKHALASYKKAVGDPAGLAELMVFYCERAAGFCNDVGYQDEAYFAALVRMFEQALITSNTLPNGLERAEAAGAALLHRRRQSRRGVGVGSGHARRLSILLVRSVFLGRPPGRTHPIRFSHALPLAPARVGPAGRVRGAVPARLGACPPDPGSGGARAAGALAGGPSFAGRRGGTPADQTGTARRSLTIHRGR